MSCEKQLTPRQRKLRLIDKLVTKSRNGSTHCLNALLVLFDPLLIKISSRIHHRMHGRISIEELHVSSRQEFMRLTLMGYTPNGKAHFNRYIQSAVHAELWKMYRRFGKDTPSSPEDLAVVTDTNRITTEQPDDTSARYIVRYMLVHLTSKERKIIRDCVMNGKQCKQEAKDMHLSQVRVSQIKSKALKKLRELAKQNGFSEAADV